MRQLVYVGPRRVEWIDAPEPSLSSASSAVVRPLVVSTCDMDAVALSGGIRFRPGTPLGHEGVGVVEAVADGVSHHRPGDVVIVPWQISCGVCERCKRGHDAYCSTVAPGSCYGWGPQVSRWGGFLAERFEVPFADHMLVPVPNGLPLEVAAGLSDNLVDAWRAIGPPLSETRGGSVLIVGPSGDDGGSIGLYAVAFAAAGGADRVVFASRSAVLRRHAAAYGATVCVPGDAAFNALEGFDVVVDTSGDAHLLAAAIERVGPHGVVTCTAGAVHRRAPVPLPVYEMYINSVTFKTGWVSTRALVDEPLALAIDGAFDPREIARICSVDDAVEAFAEPFTKLILQGTP